MDSGSGSTNAPVNSRTCGPSALGPTGKVDPCLLMNLRVLVSSSESATTRMPSSGEPRLGMPEHGALCDAVGAPRAAVESTTRMAAAPCLGRFITKPAGAVTVRDETDRLD